MNGARDNQLANAGGKSAPQGRDGEKHDRMVATLVIVLPSSFEGGELVVRHDGQEITVDFAADDTKAQGGAEPDVVKRRGLGRGSRRDVPGGSRSFTGRSGSPRSRWSSPS